jgi:hypothetical protein
MTGSLISNQLLYTAKAAQVAVSIAVGFIYLLIITFPETHLSPFHNLTKYNPAGSLGFGGGPRGRS